MLRLPERTAIVQGELHLFVKGLLQVKDDKIAVTKLRFYLVKDFVVNIKSPKHNIRPSWDFKVKKDPYLGTLFSEEKELLKVTGFSFTSV